MYIIELRVEAPTNFSEVQRSIPRAGYFYIITIVGTGPNSVSGSYSAGTIVDGLKFLYST